MKKINEKFTEQVLIENGKFAWVKWCMNFDHGIKVAKELHERLGLIGRTYVSVNGQTTWIF
jgi:hypothetical protein